MLMGRYVTLTIWFYPYSSGTCHGTGGCRDRNVSNPWLSYTIDKAIVERDIMHRTSKQKTAANKSRFIMLSKMAKNLVRGRGVDKNTFLRF
jgi:hypothetical protein